MTTNGSLSSCKKRLEGKVAIITGGASGIGEATAHHFANNGARTVVIADIHDEKGQNVGASIGSNICTYIHCDVTDEHQVKSLVESTVRIYGQLDIMFSNAGIPSISIQNILDIDLSNYDKLLAVNTRGMAACVKHAARVMVEAKVRGSIVCTGSIAADSATLTFTDYTMSKYGVLGLVRCASRQLGMYGIRVNCVSPGLLATPLSCAAFEMNVQEVENIYKESMSLRGAALKAHHVAEAVLYLASEDSAFVTGHNLALDGGFTGASTIPSLGVS